MSFQNDAFTLSVYDIIDIMDSKGYAVFRDDPKKKGPKGHDLNLVGFRSADDTANTFNDTMCVFYTFDGRWNYWTFPITTDPGLYYRENPINVKGTAILVPGQHRKMWKMGKHRGKYKALVQNVAVPVYRDPDRDGKLEEGEIDVGHHGINMHRSNEGQQSTQVNKWSAGCQVFQDPDHYAFVLKLCDRQIERRGYETFTYTLLDERDV